MTTPATPAVPAADTNPFFGVQRVYMKGQSLEIPAGARLFLETATPELNLALQLNVSDLVPGVHEVALRGTLTASLQGKTVYLVEVDQAGIFEVRNATVAQRADMLEIGAPSILAPYLRAQLADALTRATLPAFFLPEINWAAMAQEKRAQAMAQAVADQKTMQTSGAAPALH